MPQLKLLDFGFAKQIDPELGVDEILGTPAYVAPEVIKGQTYNNKCDIWSFGVFAYQLLTGMLPWKSFSRMDIFKKIRTADFDF